MNWQSFLDSLTTNGGKMFVTLTLLVWLMIMAFAMHETGHDPAEQGRLLMSNAFTALVSTLLGYLAKGDK
jgi:hypothetical protein